MIDPAGPVALRADVHPGGAAGRVLAELYRRWLIPAALVLGAVLRAREWLHGKSLWLDELTVTQNLVGRGFRGLLQPLAGDQGGPIGWLWAERADIKVFGVHELSLRLVPFLGSLVALALFPFVARRLTGPLAAPAATFLIATSPALIYYAAEIKQYSTDTAAALAAVAITCWTIDRRLTVGRSLGWGLCCGALAWCSQPSILVAAGCGAWLAARRCRDGRSVGVILAGGAILAVIVAADWWVSLRRLGDNQVLQNYWQGFGGYPPVGAGAGGQLHWVQTAGLTFGRQIGHLSLPTLGVLLGLWGVLSLGRLRPWAALLLAVIFLVAIGAAVSRQYPLAQRLALYLLAPAVLAVTAALDEGSSRHRWALRRPWGAVVALVTAGVLIVVAAPAVNLGLRTLAVPDETTAGRQAIAFVAEHRRPADLVLTDIWAQSAFAFYGPRLQVTPNGLVSFQPAGSPSCAVDPFRSLAGRSRVWLVLAHQPSTQPTRTPVYRSEFATVGSEVAFFHGAGDAGAYLYDLTRPPGIAPPVVPPAWSKGGCFAIRLTPAG